jgi:V/A-type H+-transporting ATPase subunit I
MKRLSVVVLERDERTVLRGLGAMGAIHLVRTAAGPETAPQAPPDRTADLARADALLGRIDRLARQLDLADLGEPPGEPPELSLQEVERRLEPIETRAAEVLHERETTLQRWGQVTAFLDQVSAYEGLDLSFDQIGRFSFLHFAVGSLPAENMGRFEEKVGPNVVLLPLVERDGRQRLVAVTSRKGRFALETALQEWEFRHESLAQSSAGTIEEVLRQARREKDQLAGELAHPRQVLQALAREVIAPLAALRAVVTVERRILEAEQNFPRTDATVLITAWVPGQDVPAVRRQIQDLIGGRCVVEAEDPGDVPEQEVPVLLRHPRLLRPFEMLVVGYAVPSYRELEPTLFVAITFLLMFGIMFGDVGHGGVLVASGLLARWLGRSEKVRDVGVLLTLAGSSSALLGFVYGEYFGFHGWGLWHNPLEADATEVLVHAIAIGVGIISLGLVLNIVNRFRRGDVVGGFLDKFGVFGAVFYWGVLALGIKAATSDSKTLHWAELVLLIILPLVALMLKEPIQYALARRRGQAPPAENLGMAFLESAIEMFEAVLSYMANTLSFIRLGAYAMSHAAILMATLLLAREVSAMAGGGGVGSTAGILVLVVGNLLIIVLEGLLATVQAIRLTYYEFFSKFFSGGGRAFEPFRLADPRAKPSPLK